MSCPLIISLLNRSKNKQVSALGAGLKTLARNNFPNLVSIGDVWYMILILVSPELKVKTKYTKVTADQQTSTNTSHLSFLESCCMLKRSYGFPSWYLSLIPETVKASGVGSGRKLCLSFSPTGKQDMKGVGLQIDLQTRPCQRHIHNKPWGQRCHNFTFKGRVSWNSISRTSKSCVCVCMSVFFFFFPFYGHTCTYGSSWARGWIAAAAAGLHHSCGNTRSELHLWPTPQPVAMPDP